MNQWKIILVFFCLLLGATLSRRSFAEPVPEAGRFSWTAWNSSSATQWFADYAATPWFAPTFHYDDLRGINATRELFLPMANFRLKRWDHPDSQGNLYLGLGYGYQKHPDGNSGAAVLDLQTTWENRWLSFDERFQFIRAVAHSPFTQTRFRGGFSPFSAEAGHFNPWLIFQFEKNNAVSDKLLFTPFLRLAYRDLAFELGGSVRGEWALNFRSVF